MWWKYLAVFFLTAATDWLYTVYITAVQKRQALRAACLSALFTGLACFSIITYVETPQLVIAAVLGGFTGAYLATSRMKD